MPSKIEDELLEATNFKMPKGGFDDPQDYFASLAKATKTLSDDEYQGLTDGAANWISAAAEAIKGKTKIKDFPDLEPSDEDDDVSADEGSEDGDAADNEAAEAEADLSEDEANGSPKASKAKKAKTPKAKKPPLLTREEIKAKQKEVSERYSKVTGDKDRYGILKGTKTHDAILLYEKGITSGQLREKLDGRFYNILTILEQKGHRVEKLPGGIFKLTHADDIKAKGKGK